MQSKVLFKGTVLSRKHAGKRGLHFLLQTTTLLAHAKYTLLKEINDACSKREENLRCTK